MLGFSSTTMGSKSCAIISQPSLDDPEVFELFKELQSLHTQYNKLEETPDPSYTSLTKGMIKTYSRFYKMVEEQTKSSDDSLSSSCTTSRHQFSSPTRSKGLFREIENDTSFEHTPKFHDKPIFDQYDEDMKACYFLEKQQKDSRHTFDRNFSPLEHSYDDTLQTLLGTKLITFPKSSSYGNPFLDIYCAYHQHNDHSNSDCIELKHQIQDLIDDGIVNMSNDSCGEATSHEKDYINDPMTSSGSITSSTSYNMHASPNTSKLSNMPLSKKELNAFHIDYVYPQGICLKETQVNLHFAANLFHATTTKNPQYSCATMPTPHATPLPLHSPLSLEVAPCQEESQKEKAINVKNDQDQEPFHLLQNVTPSYPMYFPPPKYDEDTTSTIFLELIENYEKNSLPILSKATCQDQIIPSCSTSPYPLQKNFSSSKCSYYKFCSYQSYS